ncbi:ROK family protein [Pedobacter sp. R-06]|uniref:ROK family protein n=1 Tax=Pedobacter sp. R-06 TaxID=3404051 RepID=UPI003CEFCF22
MENITIGADIGGSHITAAIIDLEKKEEINHTWKRARLDSNGTAESIIETWADTLDSCCKGYDKELLKVNIAMPGPMDYKNGISKIKAQGKYASLYNLNIKNLLAGRLGIPASSVNFMNDAACFLKGEVFSGSLRGYDQAIGLTLGTGLGTSYFVNGKVRDAGLWCMPFLDGIAEDYISTRWFIRRFEELSGIRVKDVKDLVDHHKLSPYFKELFTEFSRNLANFLYKFIRKKMPLGAVLGGNIANAEAYFIEDTRSNLAQIMGYSFPVEISKLGEKAALLGAGSNTGVKS